MCVPDGLPQLDSSKTNTIYRFVALLLADMHIEKAQNIFYKWFDDKHIHLFHVSLVAVCAQINKKYFPNLSPRLMQFQATTRKMWVNTTINQWENQLNWIVTKRKCYTSTYRIRSLFYIGVTIYAHVGLVNYQYFNGNPWKDAMVTDRSLFLHLPKH